jgi:hypothetical protein
MGYGCCIYTKDTDSSLELNTRHLILLKGLLHLLSDLEKIYHYIYADDSCYTLL